MEDIQRKWEGTGEEGKRWMKRVEGNGEEWKEEGVK